MLHKVLSAQLSDIRAAGTYKTELELVSPQGPAVTLAGVEGEVLNFCAPMQSRTKAHTVHIAKEAALKLLRLKVRLDVQSAPCRLSVACCAGPAWSTVLVLVQYREYQALLGGKHIASSSLLADWPA